jgi:ubiquitin-protein ligase|tara:strand:- start:3 stop:770 length:768 start_codon:yes stop_codon:yes gene_type:complete
MNDSGEGKSRNSSDTLFIERSALHRIVKDIKILKKSNLEHEGIYYRHDEENILKGYAMIIGPSDTPYAYGFYFFEVNFPTNYPHSPPRMIFHTKSGNIRYNPNFYRSGKVCLSVLNTWRGEQWTSCQTLSTVLLTLLTVFNKSPLLNEPGITSTHFDLDKYNRILRYTNLEHSILTQLRDVPRGFSMFQEDMRLHIQKNYQDIILELESIKKEFDTYNIKKDSTLSTTTYRMFINVDLDRVEEELQGLKYKFHEK